MADTYRLLETFASLFHGQIYRHRNNTLGDAVAREFYEDIYDFGRSVKLRDVIDDKSRVINLANKNHGINARRGDGAFGERLASVEAKSAKGFNVWRGPIATIEIGVEVKIIATAAIKQLDRVIGDVTKQVEAFNTGTGSRKPITVALIGVNHAPQYCGYEGDRQTLTDGKVHRHPIQDAAAISERVRTAVAPRYDFLLVLDFLATNLPPYDFSWPDLATARNDYTAILQRASIEYDERFR